MSNKAEPTVRWGITTVIDGVRCRMTNGGRQATWDRKDMALYECAGEAQRTPERDPRLVKLTRKPKPKVMAKSVTRGKVECIDGHCVLVTGSALRHQFITARLGKELLVTLEELES